MINGAAESLTLMFLVPRRAIVQGRYDTPLAVGLSMSSQYDNACIFPQTVPQLRFRPNRPRADDIKLVYVNASW